LTCEWLNLSNTQIVEKNIKNKINKINKSVIMNRNMVIYNTWVLYFDTPNDDDIAKHAILLFNQINS
jgi:hypothetical protein